MPRACTGQHQALHFLHGFHLSAFNGIPECANEWVCGFCAFSWPLFFLLVCLVQLGCVNFCSILLYFIIFYYYLLKACSFLIRDGKEREWIQIRGEVGKSEEEEMEGEMKSGYIM